MDSSTEYYALLNKDHSGIHGPRPPVVKVLKSPQRVIPEIPSTDGIEFTIPPEFLCPISNKIMRDPVTNCVGNTYERYYIEKWFKSYGLTDPTTGATLKHKTLWPHTNLQTMIRELNVFNLEETLKAPEVQLQALIKPVPVVKGGLAELVEQLKTGTPATKRFAAETIATAVQRSVEDRNTLREVKGLEVLVAIIRSNKLFTGYQPPTKAPPTGHTSRAFAVTSAPASVSISPTRSVTAPVHIETSGELAETKRYVLKALSLVVCNNSVNQEYIRMIDGIFPVISVLKDCPNGYGATKRDSADPNRYTNMAAVTSEINAANGVSPRNKVHVRVPNPADMDVETRRYCIMALCNMAQNENNHDTIGKGFGNGMGYFVQCITSSKTDVETKRYAAKAIAYLTKNHPTNQELTMKCHGVPSLLALLCTLPPSVIEKLDYVVVMHQNMSIRCKDTETRRFTCLALASLCTLNSKICTFMNDHYGIETLLSVCLEYIHAPGSQLTPWLHFHLTSPGAPCTPGSGTTVPDRLPKLSTASATASHLVAAGSGRGVAASLLFPTSPTTPRALDALTLRYAAQALASLSTHRPICTELVAKGGFDVLLSVLPRTKDCETKLNILSFIANTVQNHLTNQEAFRLWKPTAVSTTDNSNDTIAEGSEGHTSASTAVSGSPAVALLASFFTESDSTDTLFPELMRVATKTVVNLIANNNLRLKYALREENVANHLISLSQSQAHSLYLTSASIVTLCLTALDLLQTNSVQEAKFVDFAVLSWDDEAASTIY